MEKLELFHRKTLKQLLSLPNNTPEAAVFALLGAQPVKALIQKRVLTLFRNVCEDKHSTEASLVDRQLVMKGFKGPSWVANIREILTLYQLPSAHDLFDATPTRLGWTNRVYKAIEKYWEEIISRTGNLYSSLAYFDFGTFKIGETHPSLVGVQSTEWDIRRMATKLRLLTGTYHLQTNRKAFNQYKVNTKCALCLADDNDLEHMLSTCNRLEHLRSEQIDTLYAVLCNIMTRHDIVSQCACLSLNPMLILRGRDGGDTPLLETLSRGCMYKVHTFRQFILAG
jgi:hypothetical protein